MFYWSSGYLLPSVISLSPVSYYFASVTSIYLTVYLSVCISSVPDCTAHPACLNNTISVPVILTDLLSFSLQMSPTSRDLHVECLLSSARIKCRPSTDNSIDVFLLISLSRSQSHTNSIASTSGLLQDWVWRGFLCTASKQLDEATHISMPWSIQVHCWDSESMLHFFSKASPVAESSKHRLFLVL